MGRVEEQGIQYYEEEVESTSDGGNSKGRTWKSGFRYNFPYISCVALFLVLGILAGIITVIVNSNNKDVQEWSQHSVTILGHTYTTSVETNVWISGFVFFAGKLVALIFGEAVVIAWWVKAIKGRSLRQLAHDFEAGRSISAVVKSPKLFSLICIGSIAFTCFSGLGMIVQKSTTTHTAQQLLTNVDMTSDYVGRFPYGWSGAEANANKGINNWSHDLTRVFLDFQRKTDIPLAVEGCPADTKDICYTSFPGIGFQYDCTAARLDLEHTTENVTHKIYGEFGEATEHLSVKTYNVWNVDLKWDMSSPAKATLEVVWKNDTGCSGETLVRQTCTLTPALVGYPVTLTNNIAQLRPPLSKVNWTGSHTGMRDTPVDDVGFLIKHPVPEMERTSAGVNIVSTFGGVYSVFMSLYSSSIISRFDGTGTVLSTRASNPFARTYLAHSSAFTDNKHAMGCYATFDSPMDDIVNGIREIMFRSSVYVHQHKVYDRWDSGSGPKPTKLQPFLKWTYPASSIERTHTIYQSNYYYLGAGVGLMILSLVAIMPLFWGFWKLGRKVSLSPLELATALHTSSVQAQAETCVFRRLRTDTGGGVLSNADTKELVEKMGDIRVKYGEVAPETLGIGVDEAVAPATHGSVYR